MSDYLFLANIGEGIINSIHLSNFVINRRIESMDKIYYKLGVYTQKFNSTVWEKIDEIEFVETNVVISSNDYKLDVGQLAVIIPCSMDFDLHTKYRELPKPISRSVDSAPNFGRSTVMFTKGESFSSYQGEFPFQISKVKGTFLAFDSLINKKSSVINKIVFINIHSKALNEKIEYEFKVADSNSKELLDKAVYFQNSALILNVSENARDLVFYSKDTLGMPIFVSHTDSEILSVEHTHPPSEFFWNNQIKGQQLMKRNWFSELS
jgi:hypothetical protein